MSTSLASPPEEDNLPLAKYAEEVRSAVSEKLFRLPKTEEDENKEKDRLIPTPYCGYCGNWHAESECPLGDVENWPAVLDDDDFMF